MDGEEDEASTVSEPVLEVGDGESAMDGVDEEAKCVPEIETESLEEPVISFPGLELPTREFVGISGGDLVGEEMSEMEDEVSKEEGFEREEVGNGVTMKDLEDEAQEEEKDLVGIGGVPTLAESTSTVLEEDEEAAATVDGDRPAEGDVDLAETVAEGSEILPEKGDLAASQAEESEIVPGTGDLADKKTEESVIVSEKGNLANVKEEESVIVSEIGELVDVKTEENKIVLEEDGLAQMTVADMAADEIHESTEEDKEFVSDKEGLADKSHISTEEDMEFVSDKEGLAQVTLADETHLSVEEEKAEKEGLDQVTVTGETHLSTEEEKGDVAVVAVEEAQQMEVLEDEGENGLAEELAMPDVAAKEVDGREVPEEEGEKDSAEELVMANIAPGVEAEAATGAMDVEEGKFEVSEAETEIEDALTDKGEKMENEEEETAKEELKEDGEEEKEDEAKGHESEGVADEMIRGEAEEEEEEAPEETGGEDESKEVDVVEEQETGRGKRKRGNKAPVKTPSRKKTEEDVCFICFDGGELVLCDRRGCPKAYHPSCVNRDDAFFRTKGRWNCGWHLCSNCGKNAHYMCYTCTFSLCKACVKDAVILCLRGNKGFCETCMKMAMLIENNEGDMKDNVNFDDKSSWEYLYKDYYLDLKEKLSLTLSELGEAKNPCKGSKSDSYKLESADEHLDTNNDAGSDSDGSSGNLEPKKRKTRKRAKTRSKDKVLKKTSTSARFDESNEWASKELQEFVMHMRDGDATVLSQFDVQALLLEYIKRNKLRDPRRKSQIICDSRLENLFGKPRVGHFEMLKLLESHFLIKEESHVDDFQGSVVDTEASQENDGNYDTPGKSGKDKKKKSRRKSDGKGQSNLEDYAAIDIHNINLIYLRRNLVEDLIDDAESFPSKAVGAFVRIRIAGNNQKQDLYRLVQVVGICKAPEPYKVGKKTSDICLEILNLNKTEIVSMDIISNQEFTEEECKRLRQSIKCGLINRLTVGDVQEKAIALQVVRVKDWLESEIVRLSHLRDRASETGRRKELRECVEKLQILKTPEERHRRLEEIPEIHTDPNMDPSFESEEEENVDDKKKAMKSRSSSFSRRGREPISPRKGGSVSSDSWSGTRNYSITSPELSRNMSSRGFSNRTEDMTGVGEIVNDLWNHGRDREPNSWERPKRSSETGSRSVQSAVVHESETSPISLGASEPASKVNESEKIWHYKDPSGKIQGPFSIVQLRKWNATGYFPSDLTIWRQAENQDNAIVLTDALSGKFNRDKPLIIQNSLPSPTQQTKLQGSSSRRALEVQVGTEIWRSPSENNPLGTNLPSPTPSLTLVTSATVRTRESRWSTSPAQLPGNPRAGQENNSNLHSGAVAPFSPTPPVLNQASGADIKSVVSNLQSLVQSVASHLSPTETQGWVTGSAPKQEMALPTPTPGGEPQPWRNTEPNNPTPMLSQPTHHGQWSDNQAFQTPAVPFNPGFQTGPSTDHWRPPIATNQPQQWSVGPENQNSAWRPGPVNPNMGWNGPQLQANPTPSWGPPNPNMPPGNPPPVTGWGPPPPMNNNPNQVWSGHTMGPAPGNANPGWVPPPSGNQPNWGGDPGYNAAKQWNRPPFPGPGGGGGGGSGWAPQKGQRVCKFQQSGHCKKGAACDYMHT